MKVSCFHSNVVPVLLLFQSSTNRCSISSVFRERELTFTFAIGAYICYRPSVCRLSVVCNVRAPYSAGWNFRQFSSPFGTFAIRWHPRKISRRSFQGNPSVGGFKCKCGSQIERFLTFWRLYLVNGASKTASKLVLITDRKSYISFGLVPKSVTFNDLERRNSPYFKLFYRIW